MDMNSALLPKPLVAPDRRVEHKRWIRKGTQACWECKKRKVRCNLAASKGSCDRCRRRKVACTSQEFHDEPTDTGDARLHDKLTRLESTIHSLASEIGYGRADAAEPSPAFTDSQLENIRNGRVSGSIDTCLGEQTATNLDRYGRLSRMLLNAWPHPVELEVILSLPGEVAALFHGTICGPPAIVLPTESMYARQIIQRPHNRSHPTIIMRQLLLLATWLQSIPPSYVHKFESLRINHRELQELTFEVAHQYGTSNDEVLDSIEGIECIMIETMYLNNAGDLRRAWRSISRAIPIAQMMSLHRDAQLQRPRFLERQTRTRIHPDYMWFRLVQMNRYLAMMLGLPQGTTNNVFADTGVLQSCSPVERMERMDCATGGYILQRNEAGLLDNSTTQMIDHMLQESARCLSAGWWDIPDLNTITGQGPKLLQEVARVMDQLTHFHLVAQLHLPYILYPSAGSEYEHSKRMTVNASREVLLRYTTLQDIHAFASFCSGTNLLAFMSCTVLCIAHMSAKQQPQYYISDDCNVLGSLADQQLQDRKLMQLALRGMQRIAREDGDPIASRTSSVLADLLAMEAGDAICEKDVDNPMLEAERGFGCGGKVSDCRRVLEIYIPYFGTARFKRRDKVAYVSRRLHFI